ncbi:MAG TPA: molybdenum cofactor biosynthesis protein MoaE [Armatimonadota bacterium]|jgi:molybdopterin synthase catalytic subunit
MTVNVLLFAAARDAAGASELKELLLPGATTADLLDRLCARLPALAELRPRLAVAVNQSYVRAPQQLSDGDEVALLPPISGGGSLLTQDPLDLQAMIRQAHGTCDGAVVTFLGTVRDLSEGRQVVSMEYHAYEAMAAKELEAARQETLDRYPVSQVLVAHRIGHLQLCEASVAIVVTSPHRAEAFDACRFAIDRIKARVPVWKREHFPDGDSGWVQGWYPELE